MKWVIQTRTRLFYAAGTKKTLEFGLLKACRYVFRFDSVERTFMIGDQRLGKMGQTVSSPRFRAFFALRSQLSCDPFPVRPQFNRDQKSKSGYESV